MDLNVTSTGSLLLLAALTAPAFAHEDDPKLLDRVAPTQGPGFRRANERGGSLASVGLPGINVTLNAWLTLGQLDGAQSGSDCWGYVSGSGREYALMCTYKGMVFVEVTNPNNPVVVDTVDGPDSLWRDVKVYQDHCYVVSEGGSGIQVISLANIDSGSVSLVNTINDVGTSATHNVAINEDSGYLYRTGGSSEGLRIYSLANPANPTYVNSYTDKYVHDAQIVTYNPGELGEREIAYACGGFNGGWDQTALIVLDVTNKNNIQTISTVFYPGPAYAHQGWLTEDRQYYYLGDELDEDGTLTTTTHVIDVADPDNAFYVSSFTNGNNAIGHNLYTKSGLAYEANYTSGMRVFDYAQDPTAPTEVAWSDTAPAGDLDSFNGLWSVYPYLPSGTVLGSDLEGGLFVWTVNAASIGFPDGRPTTIASAGEGLSVRLQSSTPGDVSSATLFYDIGAGFVQLPLVAQGGDLYDVDFPAATCGTSIEWYISVQTGSGSTFTAPVGAPSNSYTTPVGDGTIVSLDYTMETTAGWSVGTPNDATTGNWTRGNPNGTASQPEDDHSPAGSQCWFTGQGSVGGGIGDDDVDGGSTTLLSANMDATGMAAPIISYWRWYSNTGGGAPNADTFNVDISSNGGANWTPLEVVGPAGAGTSGGWVQHSFKVDDFVTPTNQVRLRFIASDLGSGSIVEAAIDDLQLTDILCDGGLGTVYCNSNLNSTGNVATIEATGSAQIASNNFNLTSTDVPASQFGYYLMSDSQGFIANFGGSQGNLCVGSPLVRFAANIAQSTPQGTYDFSPDLTNLPSGTVFAPGQTWNFQLWFRDVNPTSTSNTSDATAVTFQ